MTTLNELARELGAQPHEVAAFGDIPYVHGSDEIDDDYANTIREAWAAAPAPQAADPDPDPDPLTDSAGYLDCGCHGSQREHTCRPW